MTQPHRIHAAAISLALLLATSFAWADPSQDAQDRGRALHIQGRALLNEGKFDRALPLLQEAHGILHEPPTGFDLLQAYYGLHQYAESWQVGEEVQSIPVQPDEPKEWADARAGTNAGMEDLAGHIPKIALHFQGSCSEPPTVAIDQMPLTLKQLEQPYRVNPGEHRIHVAADGCYPVPVRTVNAAEVRVYDETFDLIPIPPKPALERSKPISMPTDVKVFTVAGGIMAGVSVGTGIFAVATYLQAADAWNERGCGTNCRSQYESSASKLPGLSITSIASGVIGAGLLGYVGYVSFAKPTSKARVGVRLVPAGTGAMLMGTF